MNAAITPAFSASRDASRRFDGLCILIHTTFGG